MCLIPMIPTWTSLLLVSYAGSITQTLSSLAAVITTALPAPSNDSLRLPNASHVVPQRVAFSTGQTKS